MITCYSTLFQDEAAEEVKKEEKKKLALLQDQDLSQYAIKGSEQDWGTALAAGKQGLVSVKRSVLYHRIHAGDKGAQWLSGRVLDSRPRGSGFKPHRRHCIVSLSKTH